MAVKFINKITGTEMWVDDKRADEYRKLGYKTAEQKEIVRPGNRKQKEEVKNDDGISAAGSTKTQRKSKNVKTDSEKKTARKR